MSQTLVAAQVPVGPYPASAPGSGALDITFVTADASNGNKFNISGKELLLVSNPDSGAHTFTLSSTPDNEGRTSDITTYSVAAGKTSVFSFLHALAGWRQSDGTVHMTVSSALLTIAVLTLP